MRPAEPFYFGPAPEPMFGWYHTPEGSVARRRSALQPPRPRRHPIALELPPSRGTAGRRRLGGSAVRLGWDRRLGGRRPPKPNRVGDLGERSRTWPSRSSSTERRVAPTLVGLRVGRDARRPRRRPARRHRGAGALDAGAQRSRLGHGDGQAAQALSADRPPGRCAGAGRRGVARFVRLERDHRRSGRDRSARDRAQAGAAHPGPGGRRLRGQSTSSASGSRRRRGGRMAARLRTEVSVHGPAQDHPPRRVNQRHRRLGGGRFRRAAGGPPRPATRP